jgi:NAD-reducing hydrogenase small subunit
MDWQHIAPRGDACGTAPRESPRWRGRIATTDKIRVAVANLCGCPGCENGTLTTDTRIRERFDIVQYSPRGSDSASGERYVVGFIEGACASEVNATLLQGFRHDCDYLVSLGDCARAGSLPSLVRPSAGIAQGGIHADGRVLLTMQREPEEVPLLLDSVFPCHWVVPIDYVLSGCPPSADSVWHLLQQLAPSDTA